MNKKIIEKAIMFADKKFSETGVKNHFLEVFDILKNDFKIKDRNVLIAGILHDTLEDTSTTYEDIRDLFSKKIADIVQEVSHPKNYNSEQKKNTMKK